MGNTEKPSAGLRSVSETALLVAWHRALETRRPDALFEDPLAVRLSAGRGEEVTRKLRGDRSMAWTTIVRTVLIDEVVGRLVAEGVALDISRRDARRECLARLTAGSRRTLVMTEGLLVYLPPAVVGELADDLLCHARATCGKGEKRTLHAVEPAGLTVRYSGRQCGVSRMA